jgi:hypothetical protein
VKTLQMTTVDGWALATGGFDDAEPRVLDLEIAERLEYANSFDIRKLIRRLDEDGRLGLVATVAKSTGGRPATEYWLTEAQALKVVAKSETAKADALLDEVIRVFVLARRGLLPSPLALPGGDESVIRRSKAALDMLIQAKELLDPYAVRRTAETLIERVGQLQLPAPADPTLEVDGYLQERGESKDVIRRFRGSFGKKLRALYVATHDREPGSVPKFINGADRSTRIYHESDRPLFDQVYSEMFGPNLRVLQGGEES